MDNWESVQESSGFLSEQKAGADGGGPSWDLRLSF